MGLHENLSSWRKEKRWMSGLALTHPLRHVLEVVGDVVHSGSVPAERFPVNQLESRFRICGAHLGDMLLLKRKWL